MKYDCDVLIVGAGPAGAVAARILALQGMKTIMLDPLGSAGPKVGESLPGAINPLLKATGLLPWFEQCAPLKNNGNFSSWGGRISTTDFIRDPYGYGWHVDRQRFDQCLREAAIHAGAKFIRQSLTSMTEVGRRIFAVANNDSIQTNWVIDASGKSRTVARRLGSTASRDRPLMSLFSWSICHHPDTRSVVEAVPEGWWYTAGLPGNRRVLALQLVPNKAKELLRQPEHFFYSLRRTKYISQWFLGDIVLHEPINITDAAGSHLKNVYGKNWIAAGDAALSFDPLSAQGIYNAIYTGMRSAEAVYELLHHGSHALIEQYSARIAEIHDVYQREIRFYYQQEQRWPEELFWITQQAI